MANANRRETATKVRQMIAREGREARRLQHRVEAPLWEDARRARTQKERADRTDPFVRARKGDR